MTTTRKLDILAIIGIVLAVAAVVSVIVGMVRVDHWINSSDAGTGDLDFIKNLPESDVRADLHAVVANKSSKAVVKELSRATGRYPNSARLHFRLGTFSQGDQSTEALTRAAELDRQNALPVFLLASRAAYARQWDTVRVYLTQANLRPRVDWYGIPSSVSDGYMFGSLGFLRVEEQIDHPVQKGLSSLSRTLGEHALILHKSGQTALAIDDLRLVRQAAEKIARTQDGTAVELLIGQSMAAATNKRRATIFSAVHDREQLRSLDSDRRTLEYRRAGIRYFARRALDGELSMTIIGCALFIILYISLLHPSVGILIGAFEVRALTRKSLGMAPTELHERAFSHVRLSLGRYALVLLVLCAGCASLIQTQMKDFDQIAWVALPLLVAVIAAPHVTPSSHQYLKAYRREHELAGLPLPFHRKNMPVEDKRELARLELGILGATMIVMVLFVAVACGFYKARADAYPWQPGKTLTNVRREEQTFVRGLLAGKIKVPQKYILEEQKKAAERKPGNPHP